MSASLLLPGHMTPFNLKLPEGSRAVPIDSDVFHICDRIAEVSPRLRVSAIESPGQDAVVWAISEMCDDGVERLVFRCAALDGRVIEKLRYLLVVPLQERVAKLEAMEYKLEEQRKEDELDELYERIGRPMWSQLEKDGFIQRGVSYPKRGIKR